MGSIRKRGQVYWLDYSDEKKVRRRVSLGCRRLDVAQRKAAKILEEVEVRRAGVQTPGEEAAKVPLRVHLGWSVRGALGKAANATLSRPLEPVLEWSRRGGR